MSPHRSPASRLSGAARATVAPWVLARLLVGAGAVVAVAGADELGRRTEQIDQGLFAWDGAFYRVIAEHGYGALPVEGFRFFPLYPLAARVLGFWLVERVALVVLANVLAFLAAVLLHRLVVLETHDTGAAGRSVWLLALFPSSFVLVLAYAEALWLVLAIGCFLALRRRAWWWAALFGALGALSRPIGVALAAAALVEVLRERRGPAVARAAAVVAPVAALLGYCAWARHRTGSWLGPLRLQEQFRGEVVDPFTRLVRGIGDLSGSERFGDGLHVPFALAFVVLTIVVWRRLPASYGAFTTVILVAALSAENLNSLERYALDAFPVVIALACMTERRPARDATVLLCAGGLVSFTALAYLGAYVP